MNRKDKTYPQDAFSADGIEGQNVNIIPSKKLGNPSFGIDAKK